MRVIAGKYRSRPLSSLRGIDIRPTSDRLRETLFNVLTAGNPEALAGSIWMDLFAGTGAVGIEALSRGAKEVYFVENSPAAADTIRENLQSLGILEGYKICARGNCRARSGAWSGRRCRRRGFHRSAIPHARRVHEDAAGRWQSRRCLGESVVIAEHEKKFDPGEEFGPLRQIPGTGAGKHGAQLLPTWEAAK